MIGVPVGGSLALGISAAGRTDDGYSVFVETGTVCFVVSNWENCLVKCSYSVPTYLTMSRAISTANLPTLVPPNFCTTQLPPPGRFFSCWCGIDCSKPLACDILIYVGGWWGRIQKSTRECCLCLVCWLYLVLLCCVYAPWKLL